VASKVDGCAQRSSGVDAVSSRFYASEKPGDDRWNSSDYGVVLVLTSDTGLGRDRMHDAGRILFCDTKSIRKMSPYKAVASTGWMASASQASRTLAASMLLKNATRMAMIVTTFELQVYRAHG
jgi:hypothetical protein